MKNTTLDFKLISNTSAFQNLCEDWNKLLQESLTPQPFLSWEWLYTWWETFQDDKKKLCILTIYEDENLVLIAPFYTQTIAPLVNCLCMLGEAIKKEEQVVSAYPDIIIHKDYQKSTLPFLSEYLNTQKGALFKIASFNLMQKDSSLLKLSKHIVKNYSTYYAASENQFLIPLPDSHDDYISSLSRSTRKQFRMKLNRIKKAGELEIVSETNLVDGLAVIEDLHRKRWEDRSEENTFDSKRFKQFHQTLCERFENQDIMRFRLMKHNDQVIAASYNFAYNNVMYSYLSGFSSSDDKRFSPMFIFDLLETDHLIQTGFSQYDLLTSESSNNYKSKFNANTSSVYKMYWLEKGVVSTVMSTFLKLRPTLSKCYHKIRGFSLPTKLKLPSLSSYPKKLIVLFFGLYFALDF